MRYGDQCDSAILHILIQVSLYVHADSRCAFIENSIFRLMIDESAHGHSLLLTTRKDIIPIVDVVPALFTLDEVSKSDILELLHQVIVGDTFSAALLNGVGVNELISQATNWQVGSLRNVENIIHAGLV